MDSEPYNEWINLYNKDIEHVWDSQHVELRKAAMLIRVLESEFQKIHKTIEQKFELCARKIYNTEERSKHSDEKENNDKNLMGTSSAEVFLQSHSTLLPVLRSKNENVMITPQEGNFSNGSISPKINRFCKLPKPKRQKQRKVLNFSTLESNHTVPKKLQKTGDIIDLTVTETIPETSLAQRNNKYNRSINQITKKEKTISSNISNETEDSNSNSDSTYCTNEEKINNPINVHTEEGNIVKKLEQKSKQCNFILKGARVQNKARQKLEGQYCSVYQPYNKLDVDAQEKKKLNKCSKHRDKFKEDEYTPKGFWDLNFPTTPSPEKISL